MIEGTYPCYWKSESLNLVSLGPGFLGDNSKASFFDGDFFCF